MALIIKKYLGQHKADNNVKEIIHCKLDYFVRSELVFFFELTFHQFRTKRRSINRFQIGI